MLRINLKVLVYDVHCQIEGLLQQLELCVVQPVYEDPTHFTVDRAPSG